MPGAGVSHDAPTITWRNLGGVIRHRAEAIGHHVEEISKRRFAKTVLMIRGRLLVSTFHDHSIAVANAGVTRGTINVEALASARENIFSHGKWHVIARIGANLASIEIGVFMELAARHRAIYWRTRRTQILVEVT